MQTVRQRPEPLRWRWGLMMLATLSLMASAHSAREPSLLTRDLAQLGRPLPDEGLLILLVSLPGCHYCATVRSHYLLPMLRDPARVPGLAIGEVSLGLERPITDFDGSRTSVEHWSQRLGLKVAPTVLFLDRCGQSVAEPLIGGDIAGFYGAYLERAIAVARTRLHDTPRAC